MINANLLPIKQKKNNKLEQKLRWLILMCFVLATILILSSSALYILKSYSYFGLNGGNPLFAKQINILEDKIKQLKKERSFIAQLPEQNSFDRLSQLHTIKPSNIKLINIDIDSEEINIKGHADTRDNMLEFERKLKGLYGEIESPLSNLLKTNDLDFVFTVNTTSAKDVGAYAKGKIIINNQGSSFSLIPSRFQTQEGLIFWSQETIRLNTGLTELEVIAEQPGSKYNIEPASFTLPALLEQDNPRYYNLSSYSLEKMKGGKNAE